MLKAWPMESDESKLSEDKPKENQNNEKNHDPLNGLNPESLQKEFQDLIEKKFGGKVQVMTMGDGFPHQEEAEIKDDTVETTAKIFDSIQNFEYKPNQIKKHLDRFVIGQDDAKKALSIAICDHYNHLKADMSRQVNTSEIHYQKQNVLILGPTGVGKTYLVRLISDLIGVPFVKADATRFSEVGYMGANVDDIIRDLVQVAGGDKDLASKGIVYVDEVDKLASKRDHTGRDVSGRGVQFSFLRLLENTDVDLNSSHDMASQFKTFMNFQKKGKAEKEIVNTRDILFIFSGAFHGLEDIIRNRMNVKSIGLHVDKKSEDVAETLKATQAKDLVDFGFEHEFIGRLPIRVACDSLGSEELYKILTEAELSILEQFKTSFSYYGIELSFTNGALKLLSEKAYEQKTGARGLTAVLEECLRPFKFELPSTAITKLEVNEDLIANPQGYLHHLLHS